MAPPQHKVDATLQAMERAHRASPDEQIKMFSKTINTARRDFESFATAEESASRQNEKAGGSLLALVENERELDQDLDRSLEKVKESLAEMERKRMLALGAMTRLSPDEALSELSKIKEHILNLSLRVPIRADFIVHGHNISLSIFRLFEAAERAEAEVDALINAKRSLDGQGGGESIAENPTQLLQERAATEADVAVLSNRPQTSQSLTASATHLVPAHTSTEERYEHPQAQSPQVQENYASTEVDLGPIDDFVPVTTAAPVEERRTSESPRPTPVSRTPTTTGIRLRQALKRSSQTSTRSITEPRSSRFATEQSTESNNTAQEEQVFQGGDEEFDL